MQKPGDSFNSFLFELVPLFDPHPKLKRPRGIFALIAAAAFVALPLLAQDRVIAGIDPAQARVLTSHHPLWATPANDAGQVPPNQDLGNITLVLARSPEREASFQQFLADQQDPASPDFHRWLSPEEVGERFGISEADIASVSGWLQSQGLHINWISPSRMFIKFGGAAGAVGKAFQTELHYYTVNANRRMSVSSVPLIPAALAPAIRAVRGLYSIEETPLHHSNEVLTNSPELTAGSGSHYITPGDFTYIYNSGCCGDGETIGIVSWSRVSTADLDNFRLRTGTSFSNPIEVIPTAFGGVDPGPAYTAPPSAGIYTGGQGEATLDVTRAGSVAQHAKLLLVAATSASGGIEADAEYLVNTSPVPAQIITISFGACESAAGPSGVAFWDALFQQAAAEGISTFVASGDSGASGCDIAFSTPPASPRANSPNYICSSSYATCVGGTEFNDASNPSNYWRSTNNSQLESAIGYIPEGGWNEPLNASSLPQVASSGGGVSSFIATPTWQRGVAGVPVEYAGRYTPDVSFSGACHDGYFGCFAAGGTGKASCVVDTSGSFYFTSSCGTSASAPSMAGVAALLNQSIGAPQGNLNPQLYQLSAGFPSAFHDATPASSGSSTCDIGTPSMCNNSIPGTAGLGGGQSGFPVTVGYDEVTGLGSPDIAMLLNNWQSPPTIKVLLDSLAIIWPSQIVGVPTTGAFNVENGGSANLNPLTIAITGANASEFSQTNNCQVVLTPHSACLVNLTFTPASVGTRTATLTITSTNASNSPTAVALSGTGTSILVTPVITVFTGNQTNVQTFPVTFSVSQPPGPTTYPYASGSAILTSGSYSSAPVTVSNGSGTFSIAAGSLPIGQNSLHVSYTPDSTSARIYNPASGDGFVTITAAQKITPTMQIWPYSISLVPYNSGSATVTIQPGLYNPTPTGTIFLSSGSYSSPPQTMAGGAATINIPAGSLPLGSNNVTATYTPDAASASLYNSVSGTVTITVVKLTPTVSVNPSLTSITVADPLPVSVSLFLDAPGSPAITGTITLIGGTYTSAPAAVLNNRAAFVIPAGALPIGYDELNATFTPDPTGAVNYNTATASYPVQVNAVAKLIPTVVVTPSATSITTAQPLTLTISVNGGTGSPTATGMVITSGGFNSSATTLDNGIATISFPAAQRQAGNYTITANYGGDGNYLSAVGTTSITVTVPPPGFTIAGTQLSVLRGATAGSTSQITVTPAGGFTGPVALTAVISSGPAGAVYAPTLSFGTTTPVNITSTNAGTATLYVSTTAATSGALVYPPRPHGRWSFGESAAFACVLLLWIPTRRKLRVVLSMIAVLIVCTFGVVACGGGGASGGGGGGGTGTTPIAGTTYGTYVITITGTSGSTTATGTVTLTVQ